MALPITFSHPLACLLASIAFVSVSSAQERWVERFSTGATPSQRRAHTMAYDSLRDRVLMTGGTAQANELWSWDGDRWTLLTNVSTQLGFSKLAFDPVRDRLIQLVGIETWEWDGLFWTLLAVTSPVSSTDTSNLVYDSSRGHAVTVDANGFTWTWDGANWTRVSTVAPSASAVRPSGFATAYDSDRQRVVLHGGRSPNGTNTWEWDGSAWTLVSSSGPSRSGATMSYDPERRATVLFGGLGTGDLLSTWTWDGTSWTQLAIAPGPIDREYTASAFDERRGRFVLFGGRFGDWRNDTWELTPGTSIGAGCVGSAGTPSLDVLATRPRVGGVLSLELSSLPSTATATTGLLGFHPPAQPIALDGIGMLGCTLLTDVATTFSLSSTVGMANWLIAVPNDPGLIDLRFVTQAYIADPSANPFGATTSNAMSFLVE